MAEDIKVFTPETIPDAPFPLEGEAKLNISEGVSGGVYSPSEIADKPLPEKRVATELLGSALNTRSRKILAEFQFTEMGAIQVGKYAAGLSGDIRISPNGITARNSSGLTTFALDGDTGDAVFAGTLQTGAIVSGKVIVGNSDIVIDGENKRMVFYDANDVPVIVIGNV